jgi:hypothetical protein
MRGGGNMTDVEANYLYEVWRRGGNPDNVNLDRVPEDFDWIYDSPRREDLPHRTEIEEEAL